MNNQTIYTHCGKYKKNTPKDKRSKKTNRKKQQYSFASFTLLHHRHCATFIMSIIRYGNTLGDDLWGWRISQLYVLCSETARDMFLIEWKVVFCGGKLPSFDRGRTLLSEVIGISMKKYFNYSHSELLQKAIEDSKCGLEGACGLAWQEFSIENWIWGN